MGSFSWMRADMTTQRANLTDGDSYKILVPKEFGGGYIKDKYWDYGDVNHYGNTVYVDGNGVKYTVDGTHDLYGILGWWNKPKFDGNMTYIFECVNTNAQELREEGIAIGCYARDINNSRFPLKLVSASYKGTYEDCDMVSYCDPEQGFTKEYWNNRYTALYYKYRDEK